MCYGYFAAPTTKIAIGNPVYLIDLRSIMNNVILSIIAKISSMDAESKQLAAQVEAQSLLISALMLAIGKEGGVSELVGSVSKAINSVLESSEEVLKTDAELLLTKFQEQIALTQLISTHGEEINPEATDGSSPSSNPRPD